MTNDDITSLRDAARLADDPEADFFRARMNLALRGREVLLLLDRLAAAEACAFQAQNAAIDLAQKLSAAEAERDDRHDTAVHCLDQMNAMRGRIAAAEAERDALRADSERYRWLVERAREEPVRPEAFDSEYAPDTRLRWSFPELLSYSCIGTQYSVSEAIDAALAAKEPSNG